MKIIGIDYGRSKVGLAIGVNGFAEPFIVLRYKETESLFKSIKKIIDSENIEKVVVGISEGEMEIESKEFSISLGKKLNIAVERYDETLTSLDAQRLSREAGIRQKKRHANEDSYAASIMLQNYLDSR